jgi:hypothetical protein
MTVRTRLATHAEPPGATGHDAPAVDAADGAQTVDARAAGAQAVDAQIAGAPTAGAGAAVGRAVARRSRRRGWVRSAAGALAVAVLGWAVPYFVPGLIDRVRPTPEPVTGPAITTQAVEVGSAGYIAPRTYHDPAAIPRFDPLQFPAWQAQVGGAVAACTNHVSLNLRVTGDVTVTFDRINVVVRTRRPPTQGSYLVVAGGEMYDYKAFLDLDAQPVALSYAGADNVRHDHLDVSLNQGDTLHLDLFASTSRYDVSWSAAAVVIVDGRPQLIDLGAHEVTSADGVRNGFVYNDGDWRALPGPGVEC